MTGPCTCSYKATPKQALTVSFILYQLLLHLLKPLYVLVATQKIAEIIQTDLPPQRMSKFMNRPPPSVMPPTQQQQQQVQQTATQPTPQSTYVEKIMVGLDHAPPTFDLRGQLIGAGGANLHYIRNETGAIATLRGRGSLFVDLTIGTESPEPMHLYIEHPRFDGLQSAKQLAKNLIETLQQELVHFQQLHPPNATNVQYAQQQTVLQSNQVSKK